MWYTHRMEYYSALKGKKILAHATLCINLRDTMLGEIKIDTKGQTLYNCTYMNYLQ
jgi:hypothetical protein